MTRLWLIGILFALELGHAGGQQTGSAPATAQTKPERVKVYAVGPGVTAPVLLPLDLEPLSTEKCKVKQDGKVVVSLLIDATGLPRNIMFLRPVGSDLDRFALTIARADRFNPGTFEGKPVTVATSLEVGIRACVDASTGSAGKVAPMWRLREAPRQKLGKAPNPPEEAVFASSSASWKESARAASRSDYFGSSVIAPVLLYSVEPEYTNAAIKANIEGICVVSLVVDAEGVPQNVRVLKGLGSGLDKNALEAVKDYRYLPAMRDGEPVPAVITVEVKFALEESPPN